MDTNETLKFFSEQEVMAMLHLSPEDLAPLCEARVLLSMKLATGELCFPTFQFPDDDFDGNLISLFQLFPKEWSAWEITNWFHRPNSYLSCTPIEHVRNHCNTSSVRLVISVETGLESL